jgi:hypothetical protein
LGTTGALPNSRQIILSLPGTFDVAAHAGGEYTLSSGKSIVGTGTVVGNVIAASGSTIMPGFPIGKLFFRNNLTFQSGSTNIMKLDATAHTNDLISGMTGLSYGGNLIVTNLSGPPAAGDAFQLFIAETYTNSFANVVLPPLERKLVWTNRLTVDGTIAVVLPLNLTPTNITAVVNGNTLDLSWPEDHTGWTLQTNIAGITVTNAWFDYPADTGSRNTNRVTISTDQTITNVFFRMVYP